MLIGVHTLCLASGSCLVLLTVLRQYANATLESQQALFIFRDVILRVAYQIGIH